MTAPRFERRVSRSARWSRRLGQFALILLLVVGAAQRFGYLETDVFVVVLNLVSAIAIAGLVVALIGFSRLWRFGDVAGRNIAAGVLMCLAALFPMAWASVQYIRYPALFDISTDTNDPPSLSVAEVERTGVMNRITPPTAQQAELQAESYPEVTGRRFLVPAERVLQAVREEAKDRDWDIRADADFGEGVSEATLQMTAYTLFLGVPSDVSVRIADETESAYVDMRSASRFGRHDLGENARRISDFLDALEVRLRAEPPPG